LIKSNFWATFSWNEQLLGNFCKFLGQLLRDIRATCVKAYWQWGDPKTLTPGPRTPTTDRVRGLPMDRSTDYPHGPPLRTTPPPQKRITIINKYFSYGLSNRLLVTAKFRTLRCANVTDLDSGSSAIYIITHCHFLCCGHKVYERRVRGSLW